MAFQFLSNFRENSFGSLGSLLVFPLFCSPRIPLLDHNSCYIWRMPTTHFPSLSQASPLSSVHMASNHHTSLPWKKRPIVLQFKCLSTGPPKPGFDLAPPSLNGMCHPQPSRYETAALFWAGCREPFISKSWLFFAQSLRRGQSYRRGLGKWRTSQSG